MWSIFIGWYNAEYLSSVKVKLVVEVLLNYSLKERKTCLQGSDILEVASLQ